ncbi:MAG TPA: hypothetical protein PK929_07230, partial [Quisquiliibacterium sp.]|nr:hypothetical protein [Quisquiliibacterium sp.]
LNGHAAGSVLGHTLQLEADAYTPVDERMLPTGEIAPVDGTPYDLNAIFAAHAVIRPNDTRAWLDRMLSVFARRPDKGVSRHKLVTWPTSLS